jgi:hypothetical protein
MSEGRTAHPELQKQYCVFRSEKRKVKNEGLKASKNKLYEANPDNMIHILKISRNISCL